LAGGELNTLVLAWKTEGWKLAASKLPGWKVLAVGWKLLAVGWKLLAPGWKLLAVGWKLFAVGWKLLAPGWKLSLVGLKLLLPGWKLSLVGLKLLALKLNCPGVKLLVGLNLNSGACTLSLDSDGLLAWLERLAALPPLATEPASFQGLLAVEKFFWWPKPEGKSKS
jgi:hypothetical protein